MVKNDTNINKMNKHVWPQIIEHKKTVKQVDGNLRSWLGPAKKCGKEKLVNLVSQPTPSCNVSIKNYQIKKLKETGWTVSLNAHLWYPRSSANR